MFLFVFFQVTLVTSALVWAQWQKIEHDQFFATINSVYVTPPKTAPKPGNLSIQQAMTFFGIELPDDVHQPLYASNIKDRGYIIRHHSFSDAYVRIGKEAFQSWAILGSTLAHEVEIHGNQSFFWIRVKDALGLGGTHSAEREAYLYEIANAKRFGLSRLDTHLIAKTVDYYYPSDSSALLLAAAAHSDGQTISRQTAAKKSNFSKVVRKKTSTKSLNGRKHIYASPSHSR